MLFNSFHFLVFFPLVAFLHFAMPHRFRWMLLLAASYYFYMCWRPEYIVLILLSTGVDYLVAIRIADATNHRTKTLLLLVSLVVNFGLLFTFKYFNFFMSSVSALLTAMHAPVSMPALEVLLPVGISFYTFQEVSYVIDVYQGRLSPQRHFGLFALYVSFFPQLVAGPIERSPRLMPQFSERHHFNPDDAIHGLRQILWGMLKKVVVADNLATLVDTVYRTPEGFYGPVLTLATVCFSFQIYCDFSGYSDIALGTARIMGYDLMRNFDRPYRSRSIAEFWQRWHISLSTWFKDYVYIPLGGRRVSVRRWHLNILIVFAVSGLWHGANWTFIIWGLLHGGYYVFGAVTQRQRAALVRMARLDRVPRLHALLQVGLTFGLVCFAWIFFRAADAGQAWTIISRLPFGWGDLLHPSFDGLALVMALLTDAPLGEGIKYGSLLLVSILAAMGYDMVSKHDDWADAIRQYPQPLRWAVYSLVTIAILNLGVARIVPFQYFQF